MHQATLTVTRYKEPNWLLHETLLSLSKQENVNLVVLVYDQFKNKETSDYCEKISNDKIDFKYINIEPKWLSFARNHAIKDCETDILLYIDPDGLADPSRAHELTTSFKNNPKAWIIGWKILPKYHWTPPFLVKADFVYDIYSLLDIWDDTKKVNKIVWASFWLNKTLLGDEAFFDENLWRKPWTLLWWEESDLCDRAIKIWLDILYNWKAIIQHQILPERLSYFRVVKRLYRWGYNRGLAGWKPKTNNEKGERNLRNYIIFIIVSPFYVAWLIKWMYKKISMNIKN